MLGARDVIISFLLQRNRCHHLPSLIISSSGLGQKGTIDSLDYWTLERRSRRKLKVKRERDPQKKKKKGGETFRQTEIVRSHTRGGFSFDKERTNFHLWIFFSLSLFCREGFWKCGQRAFSKSQEKLRLLPSPSLF